MEGGGYTFIGPAVGEGPILHFSGAYCQKIVVDHKKLWYFPTHKFSKVGQDDRGQRVGGSDRAGFPRKNLDHSIMTKTCIF